MVRMRQSFPFATRYEKEAIAEISLRANEVPAIRRIVAFGSRVRGDFRGESDLDLLVVIREFSDRTRVVQFLSGIEAKFDVSFAPVLYTEGELAANRRMNSEFIKNVQEEGEELYDAERPGKS
jgi:predicted nucleotidyltransferase